MDIEDVRRKITTAMMLDSGLMMTSGFTKDEVRRLQGG